ncbi:hypothetical protein GG344DRAFT_77043 [Lentinula edodes]|nr:hypothetical protein GG344DRAFT_77043 [Lentinula edodes]
MSYEIVDITVGNSTETVSINKSLWVRDNNPGWGALIEGYFGQRDTLDSLKAREQPILEIPIAQEVGALYRSNLRSGAIITGQPGCGKSTSIPYFLVEQLADKRPVYVMDKIEQVYFITNMGTWVSSAEVLHMRVEFPMQRTHHRLWVLIDSKPLKVEPKRIILTTGFTVYVPSPARERIYENGNVKPSSSLQNSSASFSLPLILESIFPQLQPLSQEVEEQEELFLDALYYCVPTPRALRLFLEPLLLKKQLEEEHSEPEQDSKKTPFVQEVQPLESRPYRNRAGTGRFL